MSVVTCPTALKTSQPVPIAIGTRWEALKTSQLGPIVIDMRWAALKTSQLGPIVSDMRWALTGSCLLGNKGVKFSKGSTDELMWWAALVIVVVTPVVAVQGGEVVFWLRCMRDLVTAKAAVSELDVTGVAGIWS